MLAEVNVGTSLAGTAYTPESMWTRLLHNQANSSLAQGFLHSEMASLVMELGRNGVFQIVWNDNLCVSSR